MERKEKKRWGHRILAVLLAFLMVAGVMPADSYGTNAYAAETAIQSTEEPAASSEEQQEPAVASGSTAEAEQEQPAPSAEPEKQPETSTWADDSGSSGSALDVTSRLVIDGGKEYVEAGEKFQLVISYNVPELGADQGNAYSGGVIQFTLPQYLHVARTEEGDYQIVGAEVTSTSYDDMANTYFVNLNDGGALASNQTNTVTVALETDNLITPDGTTLLLNGFQFQVSYIPSGSDNKDTLTIPVPSASTTVQAKADWQVQKEIISGDADVAYVRDGDYFEVTYQIKVSDEDGVNRLGRLGFEKYALTDVLPENLPEGGEAVEVKDVKIIHGNTEVSLAENTDYTLTRKDGAVTGITFTALDTMKEGDDLGQYMKIGDVTNTTYQYTVRYPYKPYTTPADQPKVTVYTLKNQATMEYTLYGESPEAGTAEASFDIAAYEEGVTVVDLAVEKMVSVGEEEAVLDKEQAAVYGEAAFTLFTDKDCKNVAYNTRGELMRDIAVGEAGKAEFSSIRYGTYYIKETKVPEGFAEAGVVKVVIDEDGKVYFGDDTKEDTDKTVTVTNVADSIGTLVFTKKGNSADGTKAEALSGVTFTLTGANGKNYTAKSAADGSVVFYNIPAGRYTLKETSLPQELLDEGYTLSDKEHDITIKANTINEPELDGDNIFLNESPKGYLTIRKVDAENEEQKLSGAVFAVYGPYDKEEAAEAAKVDLTDSPLAATLTTGNDGSITSGPLTEGYYVLLEKEAPVNYTAGEPRTVQVTRQMTETVTVENDPQAHVRITKQGKADENSPEQELAGATFEIYDAAGNQLYGVKDAKGNFENVSTDPEGREAVVITTYLDGSNRSTSPYVTLSPGDYQYKETAAPEPYTPDSQLHSFTVQEVAPAGGSGAWNLDQVLSVENILQVGQIRILKQAADYETDWTPEESEAALNGAVFGVYASKEAAEAGTLEDASGRVDTITTGTVVENGKEVYGVGYSTASLEIGKPYYIKELSAPQFCSNICSLIA